MIKRTLTSLFLLTFLASCATVRPGEQAGPVHFYFPEIQPVDLDFLPTASHDGDYKSRAGRSGPIQLVLLESGDSTELPEHIAMVHDRKVETLLRGGKVDFQETKRPDSLSEEELMDPEDREGMDWLAKNRIDGIVVRTIEMEDQEGKTRFTLYDPVLKSQVSEFYVEFKIIQPFAKEGRKDIILTRDGFRLLDEKSYTGIRLLPVSEEKITSFIKSSITGSLTLHSSDASAKVTLTDPEGKKRKIGPLPVEKLPLEEGDYLIESSRLGFPALRKHVRIRSSQDRHVVFSWPDDPQETSLSIQSMPPGGRLSMDGMIVGETPYYRSSLVPGTYHLELARESDGTFYVDSETDLVTREGRRNEYLFFKEYRDPFDPAFPMDARKIIWQSAFPLGEKDRIDFQKGLSFERTGAESGEGSVGIVSRPFAAGRLRLSLTTGLVDQRSLRFGLLSGTQGILLERRDGIYYPVFYDHGEAAGKPLAYEPVKGTPQGKETDISFCYDPEESMLEIRIGHTTVFEQKWEIKGPVRIILLTPDRDANGEPIAKEIRVESR